MKKNTAILFLLLTCASLSAQVRDINTSDSIGNNSEAMPENKTKKSFFSRIASPFIKLFSYVDTNYIEPNHYKYQVMMQNRYSYEVYRVSDNEGNGLRFVPKPSLKIGPYVGWSLIFLGYSVDVLHLTSSDKRKEWDLSLYTLPLGIDLYYRQSGNDYSIRDIYLGENIDTTPVEGISFDGIESSITGASVYYIFNHKRFSYPAAFNQSTQQKRSRGSALAGLGFTRHSLGIDWSKLNDIAITYLGKDLSTHFNKNLLFEKIVYTDFSVSGGYGYNWVFAKNWLFASSLKVGLSYKKTIADSQRGIKAIQETFRNFRDFKFTDLTIDGIGRFGIVYNNGRWFAGASAVVNSYNYSKTNFYTNNIFGYFSAYIGCNLGLKKEYRKK